MSKNKSMKAGSYKNNKKPNKSVPKEDTGKITIDLSFGGLLCCTKINGFSNYFQTVSTYIEFMNIVNFNIYHELSLKTKKDFFGEFCSQYKNTHIVNEDKIPTILEAVKSSLLRCGYVQADDIIEQNIKDADIYQIGIHASSGRVFGVFKDNSIFMPILYDPNHLIYKTDKGHERRFTDADVYTFNPYSLNDFEYPVMCLRCGKAEDEKVKLIEYKKDIGLKKSVYICGDCYLKMIEENEVK